MILPACQSVRDTPNIYRLRQTKIVLSGALAAASLPPPSSVSYRLNISLSCMLYTPPPPPPPPAAGHSGKLSPVAAWSSPTALPGT